MNDNEQLKSSENFEDNPFKEISTSEIIETLGLSIKRDETNKLITFLAMLSAYTEDSQLNISFNAPSSSGKSFIPLEVASLFPKEDILKLGSASATAFYHEQGKYDKDRNVITVDLSRKIIIFLDQPSTQLLSRLRALLSHDEKEIMAKITDKNQKGGNRTKTVVIRGFPAVIFCTAGLKIDEQEATRFLLLSPDIDQEKIKDSISEKIRKESDKNFYVDLLESDPNRIALIERIEAIKNKNIDGIKIAYSKKIYEAFYSRIKIFKPRHQRDIGRILNLIKIFALLNLWSRKEINNSIYANEKDIHEAFKLWDFISESQELNIPPYIYNLYKDIILKLAENRNSELEGVVETLGLTRQDIIKKHYEVYGRHIPDWLLRQQILPMLENSGLITQESDPNDKRKILIYPTTQLTIPSSQNYSELQGGETSQEKITLESYEKIGGE